MGEGAEGGEAERRESTISTSRSESLVSETTNVTIRATFVLALFYAAVLAVYVPFQDQWIDGGASHSPVIDAMYFGMVP